MTEIFDRDRRRSVKMALARDAYQRNLVRIAEPDVGTYRWLVASHGGVFAVSDDRVCTVIHGWFFGICRHGDQFFLFENCGLRDRTAGLGRIVRLDLVAGRLANPLILVRGLHGNCHQVRIIDNLICVMDTANQAIRRFSLDGVPVDIKFPFPVAPESDRSGAYLHLNGFARIGSRTAILRNNSKALPEKSSELAWLDLDWNPLAVETLPGKWCHDIVEDENGRLWHCGSKAGEIIISDGRTVPISDTMMTRGLWLTADRIIVGLSSFGQKEHRPSLPGGAVILDRSLNRLSTLVLSGPPTDIAPLIV